MTRFLSVHMLLVVAMLTVIGACAGTPDRAPQVAQASSTEISLAPIPERKNHVGDKWFYRDIEGEEQSMEIVAISEGMYTIRTTEPCTFSTLLSFAPASSWEGAGCGTSAGQQQVTRKGTIWPMKIGSSVVYDFVGRNVEGKTWSGTRSCTVTEQARVTVPAGTFDTFHVVCNGPWRVRHFYMSPKHNWPVLHHDVHNRTGEEDRKEMIREEVAGR